MVHPYGSHTLCYKGTNTVNEESVLSLLAFCTDFDEILSNSMGISSGSKLFVNAGDFLSISRGRISAPFPIKNSLLFSQYHVRFFPNKEK